MRLAFCLFRYFPFSGLARDMLRIADEAHRRGHRIHIFAADWQGEPSRHHATEMLPVRGMSNHGRTASFFRQLEEKLTQSKFDGVVGFNKLPGLNVYFAADACFAARARYHRHLLYRATPRYRGYRKLERAVFGQDSHTHSLVLSEVAKSEYQEFYGTRDSRFTVLPPSIDPLYQNLTLNDDVKQRIRGELRIPESGFMLLMVGSSFKTKGVDRAIRAVASLPADMKKATHLIVAGKGRAAPLIGLAKQYDIQRQIHFTGGRSDVPELMRAADLLVHPAYNEVGGAVLLEAMAVGLPVLTTDVCGFARYVKAAGAGCVLDSPFNQHALDKTLQDALSGDRKTWSSNGAAYLKQSMFFSMPTIAVDAIEHHSGPVERSPGQAGESIYLSDMLRFDGPGRPTIGGIMAQAGTVFREAPGRRTLRISQGEHAYFLKTHYGVGWAEIFKNLLYLRLPVLGADNEWHALHVCGRKGMRVATPRGFGRKGRNPARRISFIIMDEISDCISLEYFVEQNQGRIPDLALKRNLIQALAGIARTLHYNGINHRDFYLCHFLMHKRFTEAAGTAAGQTPLLFLIDLHRAQIRRRTPMRWIVKDLGGLYYSAMDVHLSRNDLFRFIKAYSGLPLRTALRSSIDWRRVHRRASSMYRSEQAAPH